MNEKNIFEGNRAAWNQASVYHQKALKRSLHKNFEDPKFSTLKKSRDYVVNEKLKQIDFHGKIISHIPCKNCQCYSSCFLCIRPFFSGFLAGLSGLFSFVHFFRAVLEPDYLPISSSFCATSPCLWGYRWA